MNETLLAKQAFEEAVSRLQQPDKLMEACEKAQELMPHNRVVGDCGSVALTLTPLGKGTGKIQVVINSFQGPISGVEFVGEWVKLAFPPAGGFFTNSNTKIFGLGTENVVLVASISPGAGNIVANLTFLEATTAKGSCVGLLPSDSREFK
jgi:hypothetical protein